MKFLKGLYAQLNETERLKYLIKYEDSPTYVENKIALSTLPQKLPCRAESTYATVVKRKGPSSSSTQGINPNPSSLPRKSSSSAPPPRPPRPLKPSHYQPQTFAEDEEF